ncbi:bifunctional hydroxymethylpyrimidine kinase/phosphomethylpyrimidine kinase [Staphylospora marina]|uniref:bifunctional hydroxymethylpyrimidine kinase/phosphomethylpyrimidine kinase n=1 Tax=Staphylospora marina TaxID=2490858 RepID=UPI000F5BD008|nr:bifunctional hydroxymethylpyrimidine kinase/phosphomethylpyrimidine kinase [Staphylospora marina]
MAVFKALTIAGSDSGGGAGIQADLKTFQELEAFGMSAITAITAQNTLGVQGVWPLPVEAVVRQIDSVAEDLSPDAVKTGMLFSAEIIDAVAERIRGYGWKQLVVDPVMVAKGGAPLLHPDAVQAVIRSLIPLAAVVTPNIPEAEVLTGMTIRSLDDRKEAAKRIVSFGAKAVVVKGGHGEEETVIDLLYDGSVFVEFHHPRVNTRHTHGTGCTFAAAVTAGLARGSNLTDAVDLAESYIRSAIEDELGIGGGHGPTNHWAYRRRKGAS